MIYGVSLIGIKPDRQFFVEQKGDAIFLQWFDKDGTACGSSSFSMTRPAPWASSTEPFRLAYALEGLDPPCAFVVVGEVEVGALQVRF